MNISNHPIEQEQLMAYLDGELRPDRAAETASHLANCVECRKLAGDLQEVSQKLVGWHVEEPELKPSEQLAEALTDRKSQKTAAIHHGAWDLLSPRNWPKPVWSLAVIGVIVMVLWMSTSTLTHMSMPSLRKSVMDGHVATAPQNAVRAPAKVPHQSHSRVRVGEHSFNDSLGNATSNGSTANSTTAWVADEALVSPPALEAEALAGKGSLGKLEKDQVEAAESNIPINNGPMIVRTAELSLSTNRFDQARAAVEEILKRHKGYVGELNVSTPSASARSLTGALRVPAAQLDAALADFKALGSVQQESQGGEEVTQRYVDLQARLTNAKHTEQRLTDMLLNRTGKLSDVLAVEMQISRVRGEIEQMEGERKALKNQVDYATLNITVNEDYKAELKIVPPSTSTQIRNAAVDGYRSLVDGLLGVFLWLLSVLPAVLLWCGLLFFPARYAWKKIRPRFARVDSSTT
jgi:anti-sigma factor RsiW